MIILCLVATGKPKSMIAGMSQSIWIFPNADVLGFVIPHTKKEYIASQPLIDEIQATGLTWPDVIFEPICGATLGRFLCIPAMSGPIQSLRGITPSVFLAMTSPKKS